MGNSVYVDVFPSLAIIAHVETRKQIERYNPGWTASGMPRRIARSKQKLAIGKHNDGTPFTESEIARLQPAIRGTEAVAGDYQTLNCEQPDLTLNISFDHR
jgi:hypothetical protein